MTISRTDLAAIYRACESLCIEDEYDWLRNLDADIYFEVLKFFGHRWGAWSEGFETRQNERIMALLFYAAAGGEL